jgi:hypothetical protein
MTMGILDRMKAIAAAAAATVAEQAPGVAGKAMAFGAAAASATAKAASGAFADVRDFASERLATSHFSEVDFNQAAGAMKLLGLGSSDEERLAMARIILAATLEDDTGSDDPDDGGDD